MTAFKNLIGSEGVVCGSDFSRTLALLTRQGDDIDPAAFVSLYFTIRKKWAAFGSTDLDADVIAQATLLNGGIVAAGANTVTITIGGADLDVQPRVYVYDVKGVTLSGEQKVMIRGSIELLPKVTSASA